MAVETGRVALVTGASSGIGEAAAHALLAAGFTVYGTSRRAIAGEERERGGVPAARRHRRQSVAGAVREVLGRSGRIDVLVNNAGLGVAGAAEESSIEQARALFDTNLFGAIRMTRAVLPQMREQGSGRIINLSSVLGLVPAPVRGAVCGDQARDRGVLRVAGPRGARARRPGPAGRARPTPGPRSTRTPSPPTNPFPSTRDAVRCSTG